MRYWKEVYKISNMNEFNQVLLVVVPLSLFRPRDAAPLRHYLSRQRTNKVRALLTKLKAPEFPHHYTSPLFTHSNLSLILHLKNKQAPTYRPYLPIHSTPHHLTATPLIPLPHVASQSTALPLPSPPYPPPSLCCVGLCCTSQFQLHICHFFAPAKRARFGG
jgi:hypothetical protein